MNKRKSVEHIQNQILQIYHRKNNRILIGISGLPGAGKSRLACALVDALNANSQGIAAYFPMDGFHKPNRVLQEEGLMNKKGRIDTFDAEGYVKALHKIKKNEVVQVPSYCREIHDVVFNAIEIIEEQIIITEGIYLLAQEPFWIDIKKELDYCFFIDENSSVLEQRLVDRHMHKFKDRQKAKDYYLSVDKPNSDFVASLSVYADEVIALELGNG